MLCTTKELAGFKLAARDGDIGRVREVYFDDERWVIRHLVVDTGGWLTGRDVLISPHSVQQINRAQHRLDVALSRGQIKDAPGIETDKPVSRQFEISTYDYYGYPYYWGGTGLWGAATLPLTAAGSLDATSDPVAARDMAANLEARRDAGDSHLRSSAEVTGYHVEATDGGIGHIDDFLFDEQSWEIRYAVVDTRNWLPGRLVLVSPRSIKSVDWNDRRAHVGLTREAVKASPAYERNAPMSHDEELRVRRHYEGWM